MARQTVLRPSTKRCFAHPRTANMETTHSKKAGTAMYENEDDRFEAAARLAEDDPARGAEALRSIVADDAVDPDIRFEAAARLAEVDPAQATEALRSIVADDAFDPDTRSEAAARLAEVDLTQAAEPFPDFAPRAPQAPRAPRAPQAPRAPGMA
jgi:hypothetical protein